MVVWIITGIVAVPFLVMAMFLLRGRGAFLIAGYNTMSKEKKSAYDEKALCRSVGLLLIILTVLIMLFPVAAYLKTPWLFYIIMIVFLALTLGFVIYANTGNRFRKTLITEGQHASNEKVPLSKGKKIAVIIGIILSAQICISTGVMIYRGESDPAVIIYNSGIQIRSLYGIEIEFINISGVSLLEQNMRDIGIGSRTNGYDGGGQALKGNFFSGELGPHLLFVYASSSPTILIERDRGTDVFISFRNSDKTKQVYHEIASALMSPTSSN